MENLKAITPKEQDSKPVHASELRKSDQGLERLIELYFTYQGQTKYVARHLGIRRNTVIDIITGRMIPHVSEFWVKHCHGDVGLLAQKIGIENDKEFQKTLRWYHRFENFLSTIEVDSENGRAVARALNFLRKIPEPLIVQPSETSLTETEFPSGSDLTYSLNPGTDNIESISRKITKLKTLKFGTMMILGETGAGKGWLARRIYEYLYPNSNKPYLHLNCAHLVSATVELFGSVKGAFTDAVNRAGAFELVANGGIIFLDEIDALSIEVQMKLLLVLGEDGVFYRAGSMKPIYLNHFTLIVATNQDLELLSKQNQFRKDLLGRINQPCIRLKTWNQQPTEVKFHIIHELQQHICENDFEQRYRDQLITEFQLNEEQMKILINSRYTYNIRSVRKQITEFMTQFLLEQSDHPPEPFKI